MSPDEFKAICIEFSNAPDDAEWGEEHPIFRMAQDVDNLNKQLAEKDKEIERLRGALEEYKEGWTVMLDENYNHVCVHNSEFVGGNALQGKSE